MPYKDPERKRHYMKVYKARQRKAKARAQAPPSLKVYFCPRVPGLIIGGIEFRGGLYVTACPEKQRYIEGLVDYGRHIISWVAETVLEEGSEFVF